VSEGDFDARCKKLVSTLRAWQGKHGDAFMPFWKINRRHPWTAKVHDDVRTTLVNQRLIEFVESKTGGRTAKLYRIAS
jgi:hypothetical protein